MSCIVQSRTNKDAQSNLYNSLIALAGNDELLANRYFNHFASESFIRDFGDYINDKNSISEERVDENGEPKIFKDEDYNLFYYLNKNNEKVYYPNKTISSILNNSSLNRFKKTLGSQYIRENFNLGKNLDDLGFDSKSEINLSKFIEKKLNEKIKEFSVGGIISAAKKARAEKLLNHIDEIKDEVLDYFKSLKIEYIEDNEDDSLNVKENDTREAQLGTASFERSYKENVNSDVKILLSLIPNTSKEEFDDVLNEPSFYTFQQMYGSLLSILSNTSVSPGEDMFKAYVEKIKEQEEFLPFLKDVLEVLKDISETSKNKFVNAFDLSKNEMISVEINRDYDKDGKLKSYSQTVMSVTESNSRANKVIEEWSIDFNKKFVKTDDDLTKKIDTIKLSSYQQRFNSFSDSFKKEFLQNENLTISHLINSFNDIIPILNTIGVNITNKGLDYAIRSEVEDANDINQIKSSILDVLNKISRFNSDLNQGKVNYVSKNVFQHENIFKKLAKGDAVFKFELSDSSIYAANKTKWTFSKPSYIKRKVLMWKNNPNLLKAHKESSVFNQNSKVINYLLANDLSSSIEESEREKISKERIDKFDVGIFNNLQEVGEDSVDNKDLTTNDEIALTINSLLAFHKNEDPFIRSVTPADKSTQLMIKFPKQIFVDSLYDKENEFINDDALNILLDYYIDEYNRMRVVASEIKLNDFKEDKHNLYMHYHLGAKNGLKSQIFPSLSPDFNGDKVSYIPNLKDFNGNKIVLFDSETGFPVNDLLSDNIKAAIKEHIKEILISEIEDLKNKIVEIGIVEKYGREVENNSLDSKIFNFYQSRNSKSLDTLNQIAADIVINGIISQVEYSKLFSGDYAFYKNMIDYKKRIPATYTDGQYLNTKERFFNVSVIDAPMSISPFKKEFEELVENKILTQSVADYYIKDKINIADAQGYITPNRWKFILDGLGKWSKDHEKVYKKIIEDRPLESKELKMVMQPLKGVYFDVKNGVPTFLKYSQAVLIPSVIKGTSLEKLYKKMTEEKEYKDQIHEVVTIDGVKAGALFPQRIHLDENPNEIKDEFNLTKQPLLNSGWKLQQDLPTKTVKDTDVGSQIQKNVFLGLVRNKDSFFSYKGQNFTGEEMIEVINNIIGDLSKKGLNNFLKEMSVNDENIITNKNLFLNNLAEQLVKQEGDKNTINALRSGIMPLGIPQSYSKIMNIFASMALDRIVKIKTNGGSFIQMSDFGINKSEADSKGIIWTPWAKEKINPPLIKKDSKGNILYGENGKPLIEPAGIVIPGSLIAKYIPNYRSFSQEKLFGKFNEETQQYEGGIIDYKILSNIVGYRIPNQGISSNDAFKVVGILPEAAGDTIIAYTGITTKTGSDFDIDKMYMMIPKFTPKYENINSILKETGLTNKIASEILKSEGLSVLDSKNPIEDLYEYLLGQEEFNNIKDKNLLKILDFTKERLKEANVTALNYKECLENDLIEAYYSVFSNENVLNDLMTPIDFDFIKNDIIGFNRVENLKDTKHFNIIDDIELKAEYKAGKAGVGMEANSLMDYVRGSLADLHIDVNLGRGNIKDGLSRLDYEFSETLSDEEIKSYVKAYNERNPKKPTTFEKVKSLKKIKISNSLSAILNAFVDIAKDPYITRGNWNTATTNTGNMLIRAGFHPYVVNAFLGQKILKEYIKFQTNKESKIYSDSGNIEGKFKLKILRESPAFQKKITFQTSTGVEERTVAEVHEFLFKNYFETDFEQLTTKSIQSRIAKNERLSSLFEKNQEAYWNFINIVRDNHIKFLKESSIKDKKFPDLTKLLTDDSVGFQNEILSWFIKFKEYSKEIRLNMDASNQDVRGFGADIASLVSKINTIQKVQENNFVKNFDKKFIDENGETTLLGHYTNNVVFKMFEIVSENPDLFFTAQQHIVNTFNIISRDVKKTDLMDSDFGKTLEKEYLSYVMSGFEPLKLSFDEFSELISEKFIEEFREFRDKNKNKYSLLEELDISKGERSSFITMNNKRKDAYHKNEITNSWSEMLDRDKEMAEKLIKYSFLSSGFSMNKGQFYTFIPYKYFIEKNINRYFKTMNLDPKFYDENFIDQIYENNWRNGLFVKNIFKERILNKENIDSYIILKLDKDEIPRRFVKLQNKNQKIGYFVYKHIGFDKNQNAVYLRSLVKGYKDKQGNKVVEYSFNEKRRTALNIEGVSPDFYNNLSKIYKEKVLPIINYNKESEKIEDTKENVQELKESLTQGIVSETLELRSVEAIKEMKISEPKQGKLEEFDFNNSKEIIKEKGYRIILNEFPNAKIHIIKQNNKWKIVALNLNTNVHLFFPGDFRTKKDAFNSFIIDMNEKYLDQSNEVYKKALKDIGISSELETSNFNFDYIKDKWIASGRTEEDFKSMSEEEREHVIKNCL